jgi:hypothetical protein
VSFALFASLGHEIPPSAPLREPGEMVICEVSFGCVTTSIKQFTNCHTTLEMSPSCPQ